MAIASMLPISMRSLIVFLQKSDTNNFIQPVAGDTVRQVRRVDGVAAAGPIYASSTGNRSNKGHQGFLLAAEPGRAGACHPDHGRVFSHRRLERSGDGCPMWPCRPAFQVGARNDDPFHAGGER